MQVCQAMQETKGVQASELGRIISILQRSQAGLQQESASANAQLLLQFLQKSRCAVHS